MPELSFVYMWLIAALVVAGALAGAGVYAWCGSGRRGLSARPEQSRPIEVIR